MTWGVPLSVSYHFAFSYCSWGSQGKNTEVVCHSLLQWTTFCQTSPPWPAPSWVAPRAWLSFIELDKAVVLVWLDWLVSASMASWDGANKNGPVGLYALAAPCYSFFILFLFFILLFEIGLLNLRLHSEYWITDHSNLVISHLRKTSAFLWHAGTKLWKNNSLSELCPVKWAVGRLYNVHSELT